ncbi:PepSY domain-containing protein [Paraglaciecola hydrolytica]|uniref:Uncharacterized protein n=1 Tax=Paraglaciecola hydrolytica TaxID=1799789 RepID=A0A136A594_9ALTE|nr:PepSY domain-containing protein [Paraglaciecola hydrolytica]KXI30412.1 hypothetical protein AX660_10625 [Paraglaciecola hydrolytica]
MASAKFHNSFRQYHRWLGFFLAGIMAVYSVSGVLLIFRTTDFLKYDYVSEHQLAPNLSSKDLGQNLKLRKFKVEAETPQNIVFNEGEYDKTTGIAKVTKKDYPAPLAKLVKLHKANTNSPLFFLNITFGLGLLFFVISSFLMFMPRAMTYKNGLKIATGGVVFALIVVIFSS